MNARTKILALMVALAAGSAAAASAGTTAGTGITNTATATFTDPTTGTGTSSVTSNTVTTTVNPITGFDIVYSASGVTDDTSASTPGTGYDIANVVPGGTVTTKYTVLNNSNINNYVINLAADTTGSQTALPNVAPTGGAGGVQYFADDGAGNATGPALTKVTLANGAQQAIVQVITIPDAAAAGDKFSASPHGNAPISTDPAQTQTAGTFAAYDENANAVAPATTDLEFTRATVFTPALTETPTTPGAGVTVVTPPTSTNPGTPTNPVSPKGTPADATNDPSTPGYIDPTQTPSTANPGTSIGIAGNVQTAYPPVGVTKVTFTNQVNNTSALSDTVKLFPTDATNLPIGTNNGNGKFTLADGVTVVTFLTATGAAFTNSATTYPSVTALAGGSISYRTEVSSFPILATDPVGTIITVGASSGNKGPTAAVKADATTTDTILPPGLLFGDDNGGNPDGTYKGPGNVAQTVNPAAAAATAPVANAGVNTDRTAVFPMIIKNTGEYGDTYTLDVATISFPTTAGGTATAPVKYVYADGTELTKITAGTDNGKYFTTLVGANASLTVYAVVDVPSTAAATNGTLTGTNPDITFTQKVTGNYSGAFVVDSNDQITIQTVGALTVDKYQGVNVAAPQTAAGKAGATANPKDTVNYAIVAKNTYNTPVKNVILKDFNGGTTNIYTFSDFQSASAVLTGFATGAKAYFSTNGGTNWATTVTAANVTAANGVWVAVDTNGDNTITAADAVPSGATIQLNITVKVK